MKKVAFILAIALVFLVSETIVLKHKIWANGEEGETIIFSIPINKNGKAVLERVEPVKPIEPIKSNGEPTPLPMPVDWVEIHKIENITIIKVQKNPKCCYEICQGGYCKEQCYPFPCAP